MSVGRRTRVCVYMFIRLRIYKLVLSIRDQAIYTNNSLRKQLAYHESIRNLLSNTLASRVDEIYCLWRPGRNTIISTVHIYFNDSMKTMVILFEEAPPLRLENREKGIDFADLWAKLIFAYCVCLNRIVDCILMWSLFKKRHPPLWSWDPKQYSFLFLFLLHFLFNSRFSIVAIEKCS